MSAWRPNGTLAGMSENVWLILAARRRGSSRLVFALGVGVPAARPPGARGVIARWGHAFAWLMLGLALLTLGLGPPIDALAGPLGLVALVELRGIPGLAPRGAPATIGSGRRGSERNPVNGSP